MTSNSIETIAAQLVTLACQHFKKPANALTPDDDFFEALGIHSVDALALLTKIESQFHIEVPDFEVQDVRTFRQLAEVVARRIG